MWFIWSALAVLIAVAGFRHRTRLNAARGRKPPAIDDAAIARIIQDGKLPAYDREESLDLNAAADAEEEFWDEYWDDPDDDDAMMR